MLVFRSTRCCEFCGKDRWMAVHMVCGTNGSTLCQCEQIQNAVGSIVMIRSPGKVIFALEMFSCASRLALLNWSERNFSRPFSGPPNSSLEVSTCTSGHALSSIGSHKTHYGCWKETFDRICLIKNTSSIKAATLIRTVKGRLPEDKFRFMGITTDLLIGIR